MNRSTLVAMTLFSCAACASADDSATLDSIQEDQEALTNGFLFSPTIQRAAKVSASGGGCSSTVIDPQWAITARHCLGGDKDPNTVSLTLDGQTRTVTHIALHPQNITHEVDVMMLRLNTPFTNITQTEIPFWPDDTDDMVGETAFCTGYGGSGSLTGGWFEVEADTVYGDANRFYLLEEPNQDNQSHTGGDSGGTCAISGFISGVHKGAGQVSAEAWRTWAEKRRDCAGFDPNNPSGAFCSAACPCDVGEGDCDTNADCQPGLYCRVADAGYGLPANYSVCDRIDAATCGTFNAGSPQADFCDYTQDCMCAHGEGDCDVDHDCGGSLECQHDSGAAVGLPAEYEICVYPAAPGCPSYDPFTDDDGFCTEACPCDLGQGDCDNNAQCRGGLVCLSNVGAQFDKPADYDMCVRP